MVDALTWATVVGTWVLVVGTLGFAYWQLRQAQRIHSATTLLDLRERFFSPRMRQARRELSGWLLKPERGDEPDNWEVALFFEQLGFLTHTGVLERRMVWNAFGVWVTGYWTLMTQPVNLVERWRRESSDELIFAEFQWLALQILAVERRSGPRANRVLPSLEEEREILMGDSRLDTRADRPPHEP